MSDAAKYIAVYAAIVLIIWLGATLFAKSVRDHEVIQPVPGVQCAVVSRVFNTSVDCWKEKEK